MESILRKKKQTHYLKHHDDSSPFFPPRSVLTWSFVDGSSVLVRVDFRLPARSGSERKHGRHTGRSLHQRALVLVVLRGLGKPKRQKKPP